MGSTGHTRIAIRVEGRVQGVAFRANVRREAQKAGVRGWVRNIPDGSVEAALYGETDAIRQVVDFCRTGPPGARVDRLERLADPLEDMPPGFTVRR